MGDEADRVSSWSTPASAIIALALVCWLPFLHQAFTVDDTNFLALAAHAAEHPLRLYDFRINWLGTEQSAFDVLVNPPLVPWYLAAVSRVAHGREWVFHVSYWPFLVLCLIGAHRLGRRFVPTQDPAWTMLWTAVAPGLMLASHTVMPDLPLLACYVFGTAVAVDAFDRDDAWGASFGGLIAGLSALCRYSGMTAIPLLLLYAWLNRVRFRVTVPALLLAIGPIVAWTVASELLYGRVHWLAATGFETRTMWKIGSLAAKSIYQLTALPMVMVGAPLLVLLLSRPIERRVPVGALVGALVALALGLPPLWTTRTLLVRETLLLVVGLAGAGAIAAIVVRAAATSRRDGRRESVDDRFLAYWVIGLFTFNLCLLFAAARYVLPGLVPTVLLLQRACGHPTDPVHSTRMRRSSWVAAAVTLALGLMLSVADQQLADGYRLYAANPPLLPQPRWFTGHWGLQYYLEAQGARPLSSDSPLAPGDEIVTSLTPWPQKVPPGTELALVDRRELSGWPGLRTVTYDGRGCFYANGVSRGDSTAYMVGLPFGVSDEPLDVLTRWKVIAVRPSSTTVGSK